MRRVIVALLTIISLNAFAQTSQPNVLFVGNSYIYVNDLPGLIDSLAQSAGYGYTYSSNAVGGATLRDHCANGSLNMICQGGWTFVVLQEQSQLPSFPHSQVEKECFPYAKQLADSVKANGGVPMFYMTWGRENGDTANAKYFPVLGTYEGMDSMLYERYMQMAIDNRAAVCPVGRVWRYLRKNYPSINLYADDGSHPSVAGSYAAACSFFAMLFDADPNIIKYDASLSAGDAAIIRNAAKAIVYDHYDKWIDPASYVDPEPTALENVATDYDESHIVYDMWGRVVLRESGNIESLPAGFYIMVGTRTHKATKFFKH